MTETPKTPYDSATALVVSELRTLKTSLETIAGRATPVSAALGKAVSELCFQDADRGHKREALRGIVKLTEDATSFYASSLHGLVVSAESIAVTELAASRRAK